MALLCAYFDESGTHDGARVTGVSGFIGPVDEWDRLETEWASELERFANDTGRNIKDFHAYECENGEEFWVGIDRSIREAYYQRLARVLVKYTALMGVSFSIENDKWDAYASPEFKKRYRSPYQLCAEMSNKVWSHIKSFTTSSPKDCYPLQSADMMSYESYRYWDEIGGKGNMGNMVDRPAWRILADAGHFQSSACYGGLGLMNAVERFHFNEKLGRPYPSGH
jgi:hypothetical protein